MPRPYRRTFTLTELLVAVVDLTALNTVPFRATLKGRPQAINAKSSIQKGNGPYEHSTN